MKIKILRALLILLCLTSALSGFAQCPEGIVPGVIRVKYTADAKQIVARQQRASIVTLAFDQNKPVPTSIQSIDRLSTRFNVSKMERSIRQNPKFEHRYERCGLDRWYTISIPADANPVEVAAEYLKDANVQFAEPVYQIRSLAMESEPLAELPNDEAFKKQWHFYNDGSNGGVPGADIRLLQAWKLLQEYQAKGRELKDVIVAVVDGGVNPTHEDLQENLWRDEKGNIGFNFTTMKHEITPVAHGTHVAGVIAATTNNGLGGIGVAGNFGKVKVMSCQIMSDKDGDAGRNIMDVYVYAAENGAVIAQNSWGYETRLASMNGHQADKEAIDYFIENAGKDAEGNPLPNTPMVGGMCLFAAGNDNSNEDGWYPGYYEKVFAVAATNKYGKRASYSNYNKAVDICAPGGETGATIKGLPLSDGVYSTSYDATTNKEQRNSSYEYMPGTSMACPHVSGVAALVLMVAGSKDFTPEMLWQCLSETATPLDQFGETNAKLMGAGMVNAEEAILYVTSETEYSVKDAKVVGSTSSTVTLEWTIPADKRNTNVRAVVSKGEIKDDDTFEDLSNVYVTEVVSETVRRVTVPKLYKESEYNIAIKLMENKYSRPSEMSSVLKFTTKVNHAPEALEKDYLSMRNVYGANSKKTTSFNLREFFTDPDDEPLYFKISRKSPNVAAMEIDGENLVVSQIGNVGYNYIIMTVEASDYNGLSVSKDIALEIFPNNPPMFNPNINQTFSVVAGESLRLNLDEILYDPDGDKIREVVQDSISATPSVNFDGMKIFRELNFEGNEISLQTFNKGDFVIRIKGVADEYGKSATIEIPVNVIDFATSISVLPTLAREFLDITITSENTGDYVCTISDINGRVYRVFEGKINMPGITYERINVSSLKKGVYLVNIRINNKKYKSVRFIKE